MHKLFCYRWQSSGRLLLRSKDCRKESTTLEGKTLASSYTMAVLHIIYTHWTRRRGPGFAYVHQRASYKYNNWRAARTRSVDNVRTRGDVHPSISPRRRLHVKVKFYPRGMRHTQPTRFLQLNLLRTSWYDAAAAVVHACIVPIYRIRATCRLTGWSK